MFLLVLLISFQAGDLEQNFNRGKWDTNISIINKRLSKLKPGSDQTLPLLIGKAKQFAAKTSHQYFTPDSARTLLKRAKTLALNHPGYMSDVIQLEGQLLYREAFETNDFVVPRNILRESLRLRFKLNDPRRLSEALFYVGLTWQQGGNADSARNYFVRAYDVARSNELKIEQADVARHLGFMAGDPAEARKYYKESLELRQSAGYMVTVCYAMITLADASKDNFQFADSLYREAAVIAKDHNVWRARVNALNSAGDLNAADCRKATPLFKDALQLASTFNYTTGVDRARNGIARCP